MLEFKLITCEDVAMPKAPKKPMIKPNLNVPAGKKPADKKGGKKKGC